jgi:hypothetical protein
MTHMKCEIVCSYFYCTLIIIKLPCLRSLSLDLVAQVDAIEKFHSNRKYRDLKKYCSTVKENEIELEKTWKGFLWL